MEVKIKISCEKSLKDNLVVKGVFFIDGYTEIVYEADKIQKSINEVTSKMLEYAMALQLMCDKYYKSKCKKVDLKELQSCISDYLEQERKQFREAEEAEEKYLF